MTRHTRRSQRGISLFELLVVLALLALLFALLLPAIFQLRKSAARAQCENNLKQVGIACHNCNDTYNRLPPLAGYFPVAPAQPGNPATRGTTFFLILPFIEQDNLYKSAMDDRGSFSAWNGGVYSKFIPTYVCNVDGSAPSHLYDGWLATASYAANFQVFGDRQANTMAGQPRIPATFQDGTSNTIMFAERYQLCGGTPNAWAYDGQSAWTPAFAYASHGRFQAVPAEHQCDPDVAQSPHTGGINACLGDASVRFVSDKVSPRTWWSACTPDGGEVLGPDW